jgi:hypothetical protein
VEGEQASKPNDRYPRANYCTGWRDMLTILRKEGHCENGNADIDLVCMGQKKE